VSGIFTDGDLRRTFTDADAGAALNRPIREVMTSNPRGSTATTSPVKRWR
jgi:CBS domain-containing protein